LTATTVSLSRIPAGCWAAPEIPMARETSGATVAVSFLQCHRRFEGAGIPRTAAVLGAAVDQ